MTHSERAPEWTVYYRDPDQPQGLWSSTGTYWTPDHITAEAAIRALLPRDLQQPVWAFAHAKHGGAWYDLHYPEGVEPHLTRADREKPLGPHFWVPGDAR